MSDLYVSGDGYRPLLLPARGEDLQPGRQYVLTPLARLVLSEEFSLTELPTIVECLRQKVAATEITTIRKNLETGEVHTSTMHLPAQQETFRAFTASGIRKFSFSLAELEKRAPAYDKSHKLPALEEQWFAERNLPSAHIKFRGQTLRWWARQGSATGEKPRSASTRGPRAARAVELDATIQSVLSNL